MTHLYHFYEAIDHEEKEADIFYVQCEWFNKTIDLDTEQASNEDYCLITVTNLKDYWQHTITRDLLIEKFKPSNCLVQKTRSKVLALSLRGSKWIKNHQIQWAYIKCENGQLEMKLRIHYFDIIYGVVGSFFMEKLPGEKNQDLLTSWFKNCATASVKSNETEEALTLRHDDMKSLNDDLKSALQAMKTESIEYRFTMFSNFTKVLNAKKEKIAELISEIDYLKKRTRDDTDEEDMPVKIQKTKRGSKKQIKNEAFSTVKTETSSLQGLVRKEASSSRETRELSPNVKQEPSVATEEELLVTMKEEPLRPEEESIPRKTKDKGKAVDRGETMGKAQKKPDRQTVNLDSTSDDESEDELGDLLDKRTKKFDL
ncbi:hypothetical protein INT47_001149 [Mucor saturninus]|uniref:XRCC4 n=1 Tax=Mucor saturninus TaxID=64648 RepID=A0A8H7RNP6_9FUNG|nr:hypothetical protein INT47_001149 [Mucor saturninus]